MKSRVLHYNIIAPDLQYMFVIMYFMQAILGQEIIKPSMVHLFYFIVQFI